jgi:hypothetical protein
MPTGVWMRWPTAKNMVGIIGKLASHLRIRECPYCHSRRVRRAHRENLVELVLSFLGIYPFHCESCNRRFKKLYGRTLDWHSSRR